jgi:hypothetical protein
MRVIGVIRVGGRGAGYICSANHGIEGGGWLFLLIRVTLVSDITGARAGDGYFGYLGLAGVIRITCVTDPTGERAGDGYFGLLGLARLIRITCVTDPMRESGASGHFGYLGSFGYLCSRHRSGLVCHRGEVETSRVTIDLVPSYRGELGLLGE